MTSAALSTGSDAPGLRAIGGALRRIWTEGRPSERIAYVVGAVLLCSGLLHVGVLLVTGWTWVGPVSLRKAATFGLSFGLTLTTVAWVTSYLVMRDGVRNVLLGVFTVISVVETTLVSMQAWRGVPSHVNFVTPFDTAVSMTLAAGGGGIIVTMLGLAAAAIAGAGETTPSMRLAVRVGFVVLLASLAIGASMIARGLVQVRAGQAQVAYDTLGALKPAHAVAMHAILVLPGLAWLLALTDRPEKVRLWVVGVASAGYVLVTAVTVVESFAGISPLAPPPLGVAASALGVTMLLAAGAVAVRDVLSRPRREPAAARAE